MSFPAVFNRVLRRMERRRGATVHHQRDLVTRLVTDLAHAQLAAVLEQEVWTEHDYGDLEEEGYTVLNECSRAFATFRGDVCVGMTRLFLYHPERKIPFLELPFWDSEEETFFTEQVRCGQADELGTMAVAPAFRGSAESGNLGRLAFRDSCARGVKTWGIVMEPHRVQRMNRRYAFGFRQVGDAVHYQGGDCAAHIMDLDAAVTQMFWRKPLVYLYFCVLPLRRGRERGRPNVAGASTA